ncbi:MAG: hypothetical protein HY040_11920 [Planctomycetes bacterium]|nr:hypothetical protein [Planctomycetota bacterium]
MFAKKMSFGLSVMLGLVALSAPVVRAQDEDEKKKDLEKTAMKALLQKADEEYRTYFKRPEKTHEFWAAMKFEIELGKFDLAALHLKQLLAQEPAEATDKDLFRLEEVEGLAPFLRLQNIRKWSDFKPFQEETEKNVQSLLDRLTAAVEKHLGDPQRISKFIKSLNAATPEERAFAFAQLNRSKERATPYLVEALRLNVGKPLHDKIIDAMTKLDPDIVPPFLEVLKARDAKDAQDTDLRATLIKIARKRGDKRVIPYLWHLSSASIYPPEIRSLAAKTLAEFLETPVDKLPSAKATLADMAEGYYQHKVRFPPGKAVRIWPWDGQKLAVAPIPLTPSQAEEFFGLRYAREAIDLDPTYLPAQLAFLSLMLERTTAPILDQALLKPMGPNLQSLLATIDAELLAKVLERALDDGKTAVILPAVHGLGERGDTRAAKLGPGGTPRGLQRALYYPDRRVQYAAMKALLKMPTTPVPVASVRIVDVLRRLLSGGETPKALIAYVPQDKANEMREAFKGIGFDPVLVKDLKAAFEKLGQSADYDVIVLFPGMMERELPFTISQLRGDSDFGRLPIAIFAPKDRDESLARQVASYRNVKVYPEIWLRSSDELKKAVQDQVKDAEGMALSPEERKEFARVALDVLWRMARGEIRGYDLRPAQDAITRATRDADLATEALEVLGRMPGQEPQARLAAVVLDAGSKFRVPAAIELNRSIQKYGLLLDKVQAGDLKAAYQAEADPALKTQLALVTGSMRATPQATGQRLFDFRPDPPAPPQKKDKGKEKEAS